MTTMACLGKKHTAKSVARALLYSSWSEMPQLHTYTPEETSMINFIIWLIVGAIIGWLAGMVMGDREGTLLNIVIGIVGAFLGGFLFNLLGIGGSNINNGDFSIGGLVVSFIGACVLLGIVNLVRRGSVRT